LYQISISIGASKAGAIPLIYYLFLNILNFFSNDSFWLLWSAFLMQHGGSTNAFTSSEQTNYHFEVNTDGFEEALDR